MQVLPIILVAVVMAVDGGLTPLGREWNVAEWWVWLDLLLPPMVFVWVAWLVVRACAKRIRGDGRPRHVLKAEKAVRFARWLILANHVVAVLVLDALGVVRRWTGDLILIDELLTVLPAMFALLMTWWAFYPVERLLLEASLIRKLDDGSPVYPPLTRWRYVLVQARMQVLLTLVPVLVIAGIAETIDDAWLRWNVGAGGWGRMREVLTIAAAAGVFLFSPLIARSVLDTQSLPQGQLREMLSGVCRRHRVGVRDLLLWNTNGSMINAAVMGLIAPLRFVLITDALLETLRENEVRAVMAHEVGHVRRRHMVWLILCLLACMFLAQHLIEWPLRATYAMWPVPASWFEPLSIATAILQLSIALLVFGWVCRRFERQADTFAVQHLSGMGTAAGRDAHVSIESVDAMRGALETIAVLNTIDPERHSWRHGSIRWRQRYLDSIIGKPIAALPIDRLIKVVKAATFLVLVAGIAFEAYVRNAIDGEPVSRLNGEHASHTIGSRLGATTRSQRRTCSMTVESSVAARESCERERLHPMNWLPFARLSGGDERLRAASSFPSAGESWHRAIAEVES